MAPARIELAHADSKSAALSTELRGLVGQYARLGTLLKIIATPTRKGRLAAPSSSHQVGRFLAARDREQVVDQDPGHRLPGLLRRATDVRRQDDIRKPE